MTPEDALADLIAQWIDSQPHNERLQSCLELRGHVDHLVAVHARELARLESWGVVGDVMGTSRQAAWQRYREPA